MPQEKDKWEKYRGSGDVDAYRKAEEGFKKRAQDNPIMNAYRYLTGTTEKPKKKESES